MNPLSPKKSRNAKKETQARRMGVVDIGSNSVRLVIYDVVGRSISACFNEKVLAGLGGGLAETGKLNPNGVVAARSALFRFKAMMDAQGVDEIQAFATAAVREAEDGPEFCARVREDIGLTIKVLSGADEARFAAIGVIAMQPNADGVCGDLGGSSLEFSQISSGFYTGGATYPLGPLALRSVHADETSDTENVSEQTVDLSTVTEAMKQRIKQVLSNASELKGGQSRFYMVGGAWRAIGRLHMELNDYPLRVLQNYKIPATELMDVCARVEKKDEALAPLIDMIAKRRADTLPLAAAVLRKTLKYGNFTHAIVSSFGVREGIVHETLSIEDKGRDPLLAGVSAMINMTPARAAFGHKLAEWVSQAARETLPERIAEAACMTADIGADMHPDHRADIVFEQLSSAPFAGLTHEERAAFALSVACRYRRGFRHEACEALLDGETQAKARALGALMRTGAHFSGRSAPLLELAELSVYGGELRLELASENKNLVSNSVAKRLQQAAAIMGMEPQLYLSGERAPLYSD